MTCFGSFFGKKNFPKFFSRLNLLILKVSKLNSNAINSSTFFYEMSTIIENWVTFEISSNSKSKIKKKSVAVGSLLLIYLN
jgi:hypothetical protein